MTTLHALVEHAWLLTVAILLFALRSSARTAARIARVCAWDWLLRLKGVPEARRRELLDAAAQRDLESS